MSGIGPIPQNRIYKYAERQGLESDMMDFFESVIRAMDGAYLKHASEEQKKARESRKPPTTK